MKKTLLSLLGVFGIAGSVSSQCSVNSAPNNNCNYYGMQITAFSLNNIASNNPNCSTGGYGNFTTPVRSLIMGNTYNWTCQTGTGYYPLGFAIWIDLNGDLFFTANEMMATDPPGITHTGTLNIPFTATPGTGRKMRIRSGYYSNITSGQACTSYIGGYGETEDYLVDIIAPPPCSGAPGTASVVAPPNGICPGAAANLSISTTYTNYGYTYQWLSSTVSNVGPFTPAASATNAAYTTPTLNTNTYYQCVVTCTNGNMTTSLTAAMVMVQGVTTSQVPYFEGFEGITKNNEWPNCSWAATNGTTVSRTYTMAYNQQRVARTGNKYGSFYYSPSGTNYVYTNGIQMYAGVTYSAGLWFKTNYYGDLNWSDMSILYGTAQASTGLVPIVSSGGPAASTSYKPLGATFTVPSSGIYYVAVRGTSSGGCCAYHLNWDDLSITAPCSINTPSINLTANNLTICAGDAVNINAAGVSTYTWSTGANGTSITVNPTGSGLFSVTGTNTLTGCSVTKSLYINVNPVPNVMIYTNKNAVCLGGTANLTAIGAANYTWSSNSFATNVNVSPTTPTTYTVIGQNAAGCQAIATQFINVYNLPVVTATSDRTEICRGEQATLTGAGATTYQWMANTLYITTSQALVTPNSTTTYTLVGTDNNGCSNSTTLVQSVSECLGIDNVTSTSSGIRLFPNPTSGAFTVELKNSDAKSIEVTDIAGRVILSNETKGETLNVNLNGLASGIYYVKVQSTGVNEVIKVVKQ